MTVTAEKPAQAAYVARRGDLVVIREHHRDYVLHGESSEYDSFTVGVATSVSQDGAVKMYRRAGNFDQGKDWRGQAARGENVPLRMVHAYIMGAGAIDVASALATAACHVWITDQAHEDQAKAYDSLAEVREALEPSLKLGYRWAALRNAGEAWELARREAAPMLGEALKVAYTDRPKYQEMSEAYHAAVTAANEAYRAAYAQAVARELGRQHGHDGIAPYGDLDDAGSGDLMDALRETGPTTDANYGPRVAMLDAYREAWEQEAGRYYPA